MDRGRWQRVEELFHAARALPLEERSTFLIDACPQDESLRLEVEALLSEPASDDGWIGEPPPVILTGPSLDSGSGSMTGRSVGGYRLESLLGAGGMGEVYRAHDAKLGRDVAIKFLPPGFAGDRDRLARFEREARMLGAINHPNICAIYGFEEAEGLRFLILELIEGETLADMLARRARQHPERRGLPQTQVLEIARQITDALEAAHEKGIVHRDLKPANITIAATNIIKVLDFGLAKIVGATASAPGVTQAPPADGNGAVLGTAAYMSPEQARGLAVDKRTDIWAFGCVLYEVLTGTVAFAGNTVSDTIVRILDREPDWSALPVETPGAVRRLLHRCLTKDPKLRLRDIADARIEIDAVDDAPPEAAPSQRKRSAPPSWIPWGIGFGLAGAIISLLYASWPAQEQPGASPLQLSIELTSDATVAQSPASQFGDAVALSPVGDLIAFIARDRADGPQRLYVRRLNQLNGLRATPMPGTENALAPFFSHDGSKIGFFSPGYLKAVAVAGGAPEIVTASGEGRGAWWGEDDTILFAQRQASGGPLLRVASTGGTPQAATSLGEGELFQLWPQVLPGGKAVLFTSSRTFGAYNDADLVVQTLPDGPRKIVQRTGYHGRYVPTGLAPTGADRESGHLVYIHDGTLFATPFNLARLKPTGPTIPVIAGVRSNPITAGVQFTASETGTLVYLPGQLTMDIPLVWVDQQGSSTPLKIAPRNWYNPMFSPDGTRLALEIRDGASDVYVHDVLSGTLQKLTTGATQDARPIWSPTGGGVAFASDRGSALNLYWQRADGTGGAYPLTESSQSQRPGSWSPDGRYLAYEQENGETKLDLMIVPMEGNDVTGWKAGTPIEFLKTPAVEADPMFSPDGRWIAYVSNESGRALDVYVRPFPGPGSTTIVSSGGGAHPVWSRTNELFFSRYDQIMVVPYEVTGGSFRAGQARLWSEARYQTRGTANRMFALDPKGPRFVLAPASGNGAVGNKLENVVLIQNFFAELRRLAPSSK
jgi:serine/threonine protein kinase